MCHVIIFIDFYATIDLNINQKTTTDQLWAAIRVDLGMVYTGGLTIGWVTGKWTADGLIRIICITAVNCTASDLCERLARINGSLHFLEVALARVVCE